MPSADNGSGFFLMDCKVFWGFFFLDGCFLFITMLSTSFNVCVLQTLKGI